MFGLEYGKREKEVENFFESFKSFFIFYSFKKDNIEFDCKGYKVVLLIKRGILGFFIKLRYDVEVVEI